MAVQTDHLNALLRGELAATETYQQALAKAGNEAWAGPLRRIHAEHRSAANALREHVHAFDGKPDQDSGAWGLFAKAVEGTAKLFGNTAALKALKEGEEHGLHNYEDHLLDADVAEECKTLIRSTLLPQTREHIATLDHLMAGR
jgi:uncharacterized protein (TIGR02284 family)